MYVDYYKQQFEVVAYHARRGKTIFYYSATHHAIIISNEIISFTINQTFTVSIHTTHS